MEILDLKTTILGMKNSLEGLNSSFEMLIKRISEFKDRPVDMIQSEKQRKMIGGKWTEPQSQAYNIGVMGVSEGERKVQKIAFWEAFQIWWKTLNYTSRRSVNLSRINMRPVPRHNIDNLVERPRENLESSKRKSTHCVQRIMGMISGCLLVRNTWGSGVAHLKCWKKNCLWIILYLAKLSFRNEGEIHSCAETERICGKQTCLTRNMRSS